MAWDFATDPDVQDTPGWMEADRFDPAAIAETNAPATSGEPAGAE